MRLSGEAGRAAGRAGRRAARRAGQRAGQSKQREAAAAVSCYLFW